MGQAQMSSLLDHQYIPSLDKSKGKNIHLFKNLSKPLYLCIPNTQQLNVHGIPSVPRPIR